MPLTIEEQSKIAPGVRRRKMARGWVLVLLALAAWGVAALIGFGIWYLFLR